MWYYINMDYRIVSLTNHISLVRGDLSRFANTETDVEQVIITDMEKLLDKLEIKQETLKGLING